MQDGYQLIQSLLAVGLGAFGGGLGMSPQKFLFANSVQRFFFAVFAEELVWWEVSRCC